MLDVLQFGQLSGFRHPATSSYSDIVSLVFSNIACSFRIVHCIESVDGDNARLVLDVSVGRRDQSLTPSSRSNQRPTSPLSSHGCLPAKHRDRQAFRPRRNGKAGKPHLAYHVGTC